jgi:hypothetical protein
MSELLLFIHAGADQALAKIFRFGLIASASRSVEMIR